MSGDAGLVGYLVDRIAAKASSHLIYEIPFTYMTRQTILTIKSCLIGLEPAAQDQTTMMLCRQHKQL